jgi:Ca2+-transporting ATPase
MFALLFAAAILYVALGEWGEGAFMVFGATCAVGLVVFQQVRSDRALAALRALAEPHARVVRDGEVSVRPWRTLVPGDVILVGEGDRVPADATLVGGGAVSVDESLLTGESVPLTKIPPTDANTGQRETTTLYAGTMVVGGTAIARVTETGARSAIGKIGRSLSTISEEPTPLQRSTSRIVRLLGFAAIAYCLFVATVFALTRQDWWGGALAGITAAIALIPEEFPMVLTVFFALGAWRLSRHNVLVRRNAAIETLGAISVLCVDKTGTLTENRMRVARLWRPDRGEVSLPPHAAATALELLETAADASQAPAVDPMDKAIHAVHPPRANIVPSRIWPLQPERLAYVQAWTMADGRARFAAKGAPETIFAMCQLSGPERMRAQRAIAEFAIQGLRCLGVASVNALSNAEPESVCFTFNGLVAFEDPLRADVPDALAQALAAGVRVKMITGDHPHTALAIARKAGLDVANGAMLGAEIAALPPSELRARVHTTSVFARVAPEHKLKLVEALKADGGIVAMTGDGVNDAPALQAAHVGVAMGRRGADVAREAADLILLDDGFASIVGGIRLGRRIHTNLQRALSFIIAAHVPIAGLALLPLLFGWPPLLFPMHVVLMDLAIDPLCALVFENEPSDSKAMKRPPRPATQGLSSTSQLALSFAQGGVLLIAVLTVFALALASGTVEQARGVGFICLITGLLALALLDAIGPSGRMMAPHRTSYWIIVGAILFALICVFILPFARSAFAVDVPTSPWVFAAIGGGLGSAVLSAALGRLLARER